MSFATDDKMRKDKLLDLFDIQFRRNPLALMPILDFDHSKAIGFKFIRLALPRLRSYGAVQGNSVSR
jgi:hypothetical protein